MADPVEKFGNDVVANLQGRTSRAFDPTIIISIADVIVKLLAACKERNTPAAQIVNNVRSPRLLQKIAVRRAVREEFGQHDKDMVDAIIETAQNSDPNDIEDVLGEI